MKGSDKLLCILINDTLSEKNLPLPQRSPLCLLSRGRQIATICSMPSPDCNSAGTNGISVSQSYIPASGKCSYSIKNMSF